MSEVPEDLIDRPIIEHGFVQARYVEAIADTRNDPDRYPDLIAAKGEVQCRPLRSIKLTGGLKPASVAKRMIPVTLNKQGWMADVQSLDNATVQPGVWLAVGWYRFTPNIKGATFPSLELEVTTDHTLENPLDLTMQSPEDVPPKFVPIVSIEDRVLAEAAAANAEASAGAASTSVMDAEAFKEAARVYSVASAASAAAAGTNAEEAIQAVLSDLESEGFVKATETMDGLMSKEQVVQLNTASQQGHTHGFGDVSGVAAEDHDHDERYSQTGHTHTASEVSGVASSTHNHDGVYAPTSHTHGYSDLSGVSPSNHNHSGVYSPIGHNHDLEYMPYYGRMYDPPDAATPPSDYPTGVSIGHGYVSGGFPTTVTIQTVRRLSTRVAQYLTMSSSAGDGRDAEMWTRYGYGDDWGPFTQLVHQGDEGLLSPADRTLFDSINIYTTGIRIDGRYFQYNTGWRDVTSMLDSGVDESVSWLHIRRSLDQVHIKGEVRLDSGFTTPASIITLPNDGWAPLNPANYGASGPGFDTQWNSRRHMFNWNRGGTLLYRGAMNEGVFDNSSGSSEVMLLAHSFPVDTPSPAATLIGTAV